MAIDYGRSERYIQGVTSRIDKDYKAELRETTFDMWLSCYTNKEIADTVGYSDTVIGEFVDLLRNSAFRTNAESGVSSENKPLTKPIIPQDFTEDETEDANSLGVYELDRRQLVKANHLDEHYKAPLYNIWKQQDKSDGVDHFGNSEITWLKGSAFAPWL
jgi:hypothetical protein